MTRYNRFKMLNSIQDEYILESLPDYVALATHKRRRENAFMRFINSGWGVACICALVAVGVMAFIIRAGQGPWTPPGGTVEESEVNTPEESTVATDPDTEKETEASTPFPFEEESAPIVLPPEIADKNHGRDFNIVYAPNHKQNEDLWFGHSTSCGIDPQLYENVVKVERKLGLSVHLLSYDPIHLTQLDRDALNESLDLFLVDTNAAIHFMIQGYLTPFNHIDTVDLDAAYWDKELMDEVSLNGDAYLGQNSFLPEDYHLLGYNKTLMTFLTYPWGDEVFEPYDSVMSHQWTYDRFLSILSLTEKPTTGGTKIIRLSLPKNEKHVLLLENSSVRIAEKDEDGNFVYVYPQHSAGITKLYEATASLMNADYVVTQSPQDNSKGPHLYQGDVLFQLLRVTELKKARVGIYTSIPPQVIDLGVMPLPLYDTEQTTYTAYRSGEFFAIPVDTPDADVTGEVLELLAYHGYQNKTDYYTTMLGKTPEEDPEDHLVLKLLSRHMECRLWEGYTSLYGDFYIDENKQNNAFWKAKETTYRRTFEDAISKLGLEG